MSCLFKNKKLLFETNNEKLSPRRLRRVRSADIHEEICCRTTDTRVKVNYENGMKRKVDCVKVMV